MATGISPVYGDDSANLTI